MYLFIYFIWQLSENKDTSPMKISGLYSTVIIYNSFNNKSRLTGTPIANFPPNIMPPSYMDGPMCYFFLKEAEYQYK